MQVLDLSLSIPEENLALDEALLEGAEQGQTGELLRWWESPVYFVVLGAGGAVVQEVHLDACNRIAMPVLRRCSGGGTVVQGPGCLNYTLVLDSETRPDLKTIDGTNTWVLGAVAEALRASGVDAQMQGISDLTCRGYKFSGNAQRRRKRWILFHGTVLYAFDLAQISGCLMEPSKQPDYRQQRTHDGFVKNVDVDSIRFKATLMTQLGAHEPVRDWPRKRVEQLVREKYSQPKWNHSL